MISLCHVHVESFLLVTGQGIQLLPEFLSRMWTSELAISQKGECWSSPCFGSRLHSWFPWSPRHELAHSFNDCSWVTATWTWLMGLPQACLPVLLMHARDNFRPGHWLSETGMCDESHVVVFNPPHSLCTPTSLHRLANSEVHKFTELFLFGLSLMIPSEAKNIWQIKSMQSYTPPFS